MIDFSLPESVKALGYTLHLDEKTNSTMDWAWHYALTSESLTSPGIWFVAHEQTEGRGRHQRIWHSPKGNLHSSLLILAPRQLSRIPQLCFVTALAIHEALSSLLSQSLAHPPLRLKWPNDILMDTQKVGGILIESRPVGKEQHVCIVIGIGINCSEAPRIEKTDRSATYLSQWIPSLSPNHVFHEITRTLASHLMAWGEDPCFERIRHAWLQRAYGLGQPIRVDQTLGSVQGIFSGLDPTGRILCTISSPKGIIACDSGTVCFLNEDKKD